MKKVTSTLILLILLCWPIGGYAQILISEFVVTPTVGEFVEIYNPTANPVDLSDYYLTDATFAGDNTYYYQIVEGGGGGGGFGDFHARFPDGALIQPGEYQTIAFPGDSTFFVEYGVMPTYELFEDGFANPADAPDMREAVAGSINDQGGLTNGDEVIILYSWDGFSDLVTDVDYVIYDDAGASPNEAVDKTGVSIDGPDAGTDSTQYLDDTPIANQLPAPSPATGFSTHRIDFTEGAQVSAGGNGVTGADETSEDLNNTFVTDNVITPNGPLVARAELGVCYASTGSFGEDLSSLLTIDLATGAGTLVGPTGITGIIGENNFAAVPALAIKSTGEIFGTNTAENTGLFQIDATSGTGFLVANTGLAGVDGIAFDGNDQLWAVDFGNFPFADLYMVDEVTGATTLVGPTGFAIRGLAFDPTTGVLWGSDGGGGFGGQPADGIYTIDINTGAATLVGKTGLGGSTADIHFDQQGNLYGTKGGGMNLNNLISIDKATGAGTVIGPIGFLAVAGLAAWLERVVVSVNDDSPSIPTEYALHQNYPNPFNPSTTIRYDLKENAEVRLEIFNILGQKVRTLVNERQTAGSRSVIWEARNDIGEAVTSGVYFYRLQAGEFVETKKLLLLK